MQTDTKTFLRAGVDDKVINFRPSPNFLNMKRFLKKKIVDTENIKDIPACLSIEPLQAKECDMLTVKKKEVLVQPPLPQYPPPPDSPPSLDIVKKEVEDDSYESSAASLQAENASLQITPVKQGTLKQQKFVMCKDFIRGTCIRKQCKYTHITDVTQLEGVYTFCWNYQNTGCYKPNCKYVHANPFEEGEFYRTGVLPPRALAHIKKQNILPPPPPPPEEAPPKLPPIFKIPPPPICNSGEKADVGAAGGGAVPAEPAPCASPLAKAGKKREWSKVEGASSPDDELEDQSSCKYCVDMEFRLQYNKDNVEKMIRSSKKFEEKMRAVERKQHKLYSVLATLLKPNNFLEQLSALLEGDAGSL